MQLVTEPTLDFLVAVGVLIFLDSRVGVGGAASEHRQRLAVGRELFPEVRQQSGQAPEQVVEYLFDQIPMPGEFPVEPRIHIIRWGQPSLFRIAVLDLIEAADLAEFRVAFQFADETGGGWMPKQQAGDGGAPQRLDRVFVAFTAALRHERLQKPVVRQGLQDAAKAQDFRGGVEIVPRKEGRLC